MRLLLAIVVAAGCYNPNPADGAFKCDSANGNLCPMGLHCDTSTGLCVHKPSLLDMSNSPITFDNDASVTPADRTCGQRVGDGAVSGLVNLGAVNGAGDESGLAVTNDGSRIYYLSGGALMTAPLTNAKTAGAPQAVTVTGVTTVFGISFGSDGSLYASGSAANVNQIFKLHLDSATQATLAMPTDAHQPIGGCPITDLALTNGDPTLPLYVAYPLAGCSMPNGRGSYIAQGALDTQMGTFVTALPTSGYRAPYVLPDGLTMFLASVGATARLYYAQRPDTDSLWTGPLSLPLSSVGGNGTRDAQAVVSPDCSTLYISSERAGGKGGLDLWAADIASK
jgi:WD40-like Beta Propeller Repeat